MRWFRFYDEALDDPKVQRLPPHLFKAWVNLLCLCSKEDGKLPSNDDIAFRLRISVQDAAQYVEDLILAGLIDVQAMGARTPHNWGERQYASDSSAERTRKYRKTKDAKSCDVTSDVTVTVQNRTDSDTDTDKIITPLPPKGGGQTKRGSRLAENWTLPDEWREWTEVRCPASTREAIEREALVFANYWQASAGAKAVKLDWFKTWQNWCLRAFATAPVRPPSPQNQNYFERRAASARTIIELAGGL